MAMITQQEVLNSLYNAGNLFTGRKSSIGTSAVQLTATSFKCTGVTVVAPSANTANVYVGKSTVTADSADSTDGVLIEPGQGLFITANDPSLLYAISTATGQKLFFIVTY